jgi:tetratricopeptide (TPR) repeat protein
VRAHPLLDWGHPVTPRSFAAVVLREGFWGRAWIRGPDDFLPILKDYAHSLLTESAWVGAVLAVIAVASARRRGWPVGLPLLVMAANLVVLALHGSRSDLFIWHRYYIPSYLCLALLAAWGWQTLAEMASRPILAVASLLPPLALLVIGWRPNDRSRYRIGEDYSRHLLATLPPGSQLIASDDNILFVLMYLNLGEQVRPDVHLILEGVGGSNLPPLSFNPDVDPVFLTHYPNWKIATLDAIPVGLAFRAWRVGTPVPPASSVPERLDGELDPRVPKDYLTRNLIGNFHQMRAMTFELRDWTAARRELELAAESAPDNDVLFYNLGLIYRRNGLLEDALAAFQRSVQINPREIASLSKPRAAHRAAEVQAEIVQRDQLLAELSRDPALEGLPPGSLQYRTVLARRLGALGKPSWARGVLLATP